MAVSITKVADWTGDTSNASSYVSPSFTPTVGRKLYVALLQTGTADSAPGLAPTVPGLTYTIRARVARAGDQLCIYESDGPVVSGVSQTLTLTLPSDASSGIIGCIWDADGILNQASSTSSIRSVSGTPQIGTTATQASGAPPPTVTLPATPLATSGLLSAMGNAVNPAVTTQPSGFTEDFKSGFATPTSGFAAGHVNSGFTTNPVVWGSNSGSTSASLVVELDVAGFTGWGTPI